MAEVADVGPDAVLRHDAHADDPSTAFALSRIGGGSLAPTPVGVFRDVEAPIYDELMADQLKSAAATAPELEDDPLAALLAGSDTWVVA